MLRVNKVGSDNLTDCFPKFPIRSSYMKLGYDDFTSIYACMFVCAHTCLHGVCIHVEWICVSVWSQRRPSDVFCEHVPPYFFDTVFQ